MKRILLLLILGMCGCQSKREGEIKRAADYLNARHLKWRIGTETGLFCVSAFKPPAPYSDPHSYHIECSPFLAMAVSDIIADYDQNKRGYNEMAPPLAEGGPQ